MIIGQRPMYHGIYHASVNKVFIGIQFIIPGRDGKHTPYIINSHSQKQAPEQAVIPYQRRCILLFFYCCIFHSIYSHFVILFLIIPLFAKKLPKQRKPLSADPSYIHSKIRRPSYCLRRRRILISLMAAPGISCRTAQLYHIFCY